MRRRWSIRANPFATNTNATFLADSQNNNAWAVFGDATYEFNKQWELDAAIRYDQDQRQNTTDTPNAVPAAVTRPAPTRARCAMPPSTRRSPRRTLRYKPTDDLTFYGGWSRGFRSGGFNQTGVGAVAAAEGQLGVHDLFQAEIADTWEVGAKSQWLDRRLSANAGALLHRLDTTATSSSTMRPPRPRTSAISMRCTKAASSS